MVLGPPPLAEGGLGEGGCDVNLPVLHRLVIESPLSVDAAAARIASHTEPRNWMRMTITIGFWTIGWKGDDQYEGETLGSEFHIVRIMGYSNMFAPELHGTIHRHGKGSRIEIDMRPQLYAVVISAVMLSLTAVGLTIGSRDVGMDALGVVLVAAFLGIFAYVGFWYEVWKQTPHLHRIFDSA
jgi:hypothetical protein